MNLALLTSIGKFVLNPKVYKTIGIIIIVLMFLYLFIDRNNQEANAIRQTANVAALNKQSKEYKDKLDQIVIENGVLILSKKEIKESSSKEIEFMKKQLEVKDIKIRNLISMNTGSIKTHSQGSVVLRDTITQHDTVVSKIDTLMFGVWTNPWDSINFKLKIPEFKLDFDLYTNDTIFCAVYRYKEKPWKIKNILPWNFREWVYGGSGNLTRPNSKVNLKFINKKD